MNFRFLDFTDDVINTVMEESTAEKTTIIFPNHNSKNIASQIMQDIWQFTDTNLVTMQDINELLACNEKPPLQDAKRYLMFYQSIKEEYKEKYNLPDYFTAMSFVNQFLNLFMECREECLEIDEIAEKLQTKSFLADWQEETWRDLLSIREDYQKYLHDTDFDDLIFVPLNFETVEMYLAEYENIVFANQFYFTQSEKQLIKRLDKTKNITLYFQAPESMIDKEKLEMNKEIDISKIKTKPKIHLYSATNDFSQLNKVIEVVDRENIQTIVDYDFFDAHWFRMLSNELFALPQTYPIENSEIYQFFKTLLNLLSEMKYVPTQKTLLIPLSDIFHAVNCSCFHDYFFQTELSVTMQLFHKLAQRGILYIDPFNLKTIYDATDNADIIEGFTKFTTLIKNLLKIKQLNELIDQIDTNDGINIKNICRQDTLDFTNLLDTFYEKLANLYTIEEFEIVTDWKTIFHASPQKPLIVSILKFLIQFIKQEKVAFNTENTGQIRFTTLNDTRNIKYQKLLIMNATEGILPKAKAIDFVFNEKQRETIGLKTYSDVRAREKYYFLRAVLNSEQVHIFYTENEDENIEKSSFVEEIEIYCTENIKTEICDDIGYGEFYDNENDTEETIENAENMADINFYTIPANFDTDFAAPHIIRLNTYSIMEIIKDPMKWFINTNLAFRDQIYPEKDMLSPKIVGTIAHSFIERIYKKEIEHANTNTITMKQFKEALHPKNCDKIFEEMIYGNFLYKFPHDFSGKYFENILYPFLKENILKFFLIDEMANIDDDSTIKMEFAPPETMLLKTDNYTVYIAGKLDMLITEDQPETTTHFIIDFKTGEENYSQLYIYQHLLQNMLENTDKQIIYKLKFFSLLNKDQKKAKENDCNSIEELIQKLKNALDICYQKQCYPYPKAISNRNEFADISRINIFRQDRPDFWKN